MRTLRYLAAGLVALLFIGAAGYAFWFATRPTEPPSVELTTPELCFRTLPPQPDGPIFFNLEALNHLKAHWDQWGPAFGGDSALPEELAVQFDAATRSPQTWRAFDRKWRFGAVLLTGDPASFRPLLDHLRTSEDWKLTQIDPTSYIFQRRPDRVWTKADLESVLGIFNDHSLAEQHAARVQLAHRLLFIEEIPTAKALLDEVIKADPASLPAWTEMAGVNGMAGQWKESLEAAERARSLDFHYRPARIAQANAYYAMGHFDRALMVTRGLYQELPSDGQILLLHAKVAHAAHAYMEEIAVLQTMITSAKGGAQPVGVLQIYLGQAYAAMGENGSAYEQLKAALKDPSISDADRSFAEKALDRFNSRNEFLNNVPTLPQSSLLDAQSGRP